MKPLGNERGMVLLLVLVVVALLTALLSEFSFSSLVDLRLAETFRDSSRAYYLAKGGVRAGRMLLQDDRNQYDGPDELWHQGVAGYPVGDGTVSITIEDLGGKVDLNGLVTSLGNIDPVIKDRCLRLFAALKFDDPAGMVDALIDWLDPDDNPEPLGAESNYYLGLPHPYPAKNGPLDSFDELLLVKGFDRKVVTALAPHATVYGSDKININTASKEVLLALSSQMDDTAVKAIIAARDEEPFKTLQRLKDLPAMATLYGAIYTYIDIRSDTYRIHSQGQVGDGTRTVVAVVRKSGDQVLYQRVN